MNLKSYISKLQNSSQKINVFKFINNFGSVNKNLGKIFDLWTTNGSPVSGSTTVNSQGVTLTKNSSGAVNFKNPAQGKNIFILSTNFKSYFAPIDQNDSNRIYPEILSGVVHVWDRVWQSANISGNTLVNINSTSFSRFSDGEGLSLWFIKNSLTVSTTSNLSPTYTITYINQLNQTKVVNFSMPQILNSYHYQYSCRSIPLAPGDTGIRSITSIRETGGVSSVYTYNLFIAKYYGAFPFSTLAGNQTENNFLLPLQEIDKDACLTFGVQFDSSRRTNSTVQTAEEEFTITLSSLSFMGEITLIEL